MVVGLLKKKILVPRPRLWWIGGSLYMDGGLHQPEDAFLRAEKLGVETVTWFRAVFTSSLCFLGKTRSYLRLNDRVHGVAVMSVESTCWPPLIGGRRKVSGVCESDFRRDNELVGETRLCIRGYRDPAIASLVLAGTVDSSDHRRRDGLLTGDRVETVGDIRLLREDCVNGPC